MNVITEYTDATGDTVCCGSKLFNVPSHVMVALLVTLAAVIVEGALLIARPDMTDILLPVLSATIAVWVPSPVSYSPSPSTTSTTVTRPATATA